MNLLGLLFDVGLAVLLVVTIGYCARLSKRIRLLQDGRGELATMIAQFDQATGRAVTSFAELQSVSKRITEALQLKIDKANFLADDLAFLIEKSNKLMRELEQLNVKRTAEMASTPKPQQGPSQPQSYFKAPPPAPAVNSLKPAASRATVLPPPETPASVATAASLEALLNRLASGTGIAPQSAAKPASVRPAQPMQSPRTDAERELLEALKSGR